MSHILALHATKAIRIIKCLWTFVLHLWLLRTDRKKQLILLYVLSRSLHGTGRY